MKPYPLLFKPLLKERVWGGSRLSSFYNDEASNGCIGEAWVVSDYPGEKSIISNGILAGKTLSDIMQMYPDWLYRRGLKKFPLLVKILDSNADSSVQVHPDDRYAELHENGESGKCECWYILDCEPGAEIVLGHTARSKDEFMQLIKNNRWDVLLNRVAVKPGDFYYIPSGTVHALGKGILLYEVQQNSDLTYRLYDYDRIGLDGRKRELNIQKAIDVLQFNQRLKADSRMDFIITKQRNIQKILLLFGQYFFVEKWHVNGTYISPTKHVFQLFYVLDGTARLFYNNGLLDLTGGSSLMIPSGLGRFSIAGHVNMLVSYPRLKISDLMPYTRPAQGLTRSQLP